MGLIAGSGAAVLCPSPAPVAPTPGVSPQTGLGYPPLPLPHIPTLGYPPPLPPALPGVPPHPQPLPPWVPVRRWVPVLVYLQLRACRGVPRCTPAPPLRACLLPPVASCLSVCLSV